ncbi:hypothetical protein L1887_25617 [Cichorium endivia]|nr:hypothetical protein L1887_25617 [Cichorium endivia]
MLHTGTETKRKLGRKENKGNGKCLGTKEENSGMVVVGGAVAYMEEPTGEAGTPSSSSSSALSVGIYPLFIVFVGVSSVIHPENFTSSESNYNGVCGTGNEIGVVWTISSLIAASARHYLFLPIIAEPKTLDSLVLTDANTQGVLCINKEYLEELRVKPLSAFSSLKRTLVPVLNLFEENPCSSFEYEDLAIAVIGNGRRRR